MKESKIEKYLISEEKMSMDSTTKRKIREMGDYIVREIEELTMTIDKSDSSEEQTELSNMLLDEFLKFFKIPSGKGKFFVNDD